MRAAVSGEVGFELHVEDAGEGCPGAGRDERAVGAVPALRVSARACLHGTPGLPDGPWTGVAAVEQGQPSGATQAAQEARGWKPATAMHSAWAGPGLGLRLRARRLRQRAEDQMPDRDRRVHQDQLGDRCRRVDPVRPRGRGPVATRQRPRRAEVCSIGQWPRVRLAGHPALGAIREHRPGAKRSGQALAERRRRELQRQVPGRMSEPGVVQESHRGEGRHRAMATALQ